MGNTKPLLTVVIASVCDEARSELLKRACESVRAMVGDHDYSILVVANGARVSPRVLDWLAARQDVRVIRLRSGSHPLARRVGAEMADGEFLAFLDDDDELMPDTLGRKIAQFREHPEIDVLISDGLRVNGASETKIFPPPEARSTDLVETMMHAAWNAGAFTLRAQNIDLSAFDAELRHMEWTLTALELASRCSIGFLDEPTYRYYETTPDSLSKRAEHILAAPEVWRRLSKRYADTRYADVTKRRYGRECHNAIWAQAHLNVFDAWRLHINSMATPGGLRFVSASGKLMLVTLRRMFT